MNRNKKLVVLIVSFILLLAVINYVSAFSLGAVNQKETNVAQENNYKIFVTSQRFNGNLGGIDGADFKCNSAASKAGLRNDWKALISYIEMHGSEYNQSVTVYHARDRVDEGRFYDVKGNILANSKTDLFDGTLKKNVQYDENGRRRWGYVWTNTKSDGSAKYYNNTYLCDGWESSSSTHRGLTGHSYKSNKNWLDDRLYSCNSYQRLYCVGEN